MILLAAATLLSAQIDDYARNYEEVSPAEAALSIQVYLMQGMLATYHDEMRAEGRYLTLIHNGITIAVRGYEEPGADRAGGWYMRSLHAHRFDLEPVQVTYDDDTYEAIIHLRCEADAGDCIGAYSASGLFPDPVEDRSRGELFVRFRTLFWEDDYGPDMEALFEVWRSAPEEYVDPGR